MKFMDEINLKLCDIKENLPDFILEKFKSRAFTRVNSYPQNYSSLISILSEKHGVSEENIILTNGVDEGIEILARLFNQDILIFSPTYVEYVDAPERNGFNFSTLNCFTGTGFKIKYADDQIKNRSLIYLCNPNNPFGIISRAEILDLITKTEAIVVVDETYIDFDGESVVNDIKTRPNLVVLRSFSKSFSIAGLRIGYVIADREVIQKINKIKLYFNVSTVAVEVAKILLEEEEYFLKLRTAIKGRKTKFEDFLVEKDFPLIRTNTNNIILKFKTEAEADRLYQYLLENKITTNQGDGVSTYGLDNTFIRFACGTDDQMERVTSVMNKYV